MKKTNFGKMIIGLAILGLTIALVGCPVSVGRTHNPSAQSPGPPPGQGWGDPGPPPTIVPIRITFNSTGGSPTPPPLHGPPLSIITLPAGPMRAGGYFFTEWNTSPTGPGNGFRAGDPFTLSTDLTLYARWVFVGPTLPQPPEPPSGDPGGGFLGTGVNLRGQVYVSFPTMFPSFSVTYMPFTENLSVNAGPLASGGITVGQLDVSVATPGMGAPALSPIAGWLGGLHSNFNGVTAIPPDAMIAVLEMETGMGPLSREQWTIFSGIPTAINAEFGLVEYVFVDRDVTVGGFGIIESIDGFTLISDNFTLHLRRGWNAVHFSERLINFNDEAHTGTRRITVSHDNPNLRWVVGGNGRQWHYN